MSKKETSGWSEIWINSEFGSETEFFPCLLALSVVSVSGLGKFCVISGHSCDSYS